MPNYNITVTEGYTPYTFDEMIKPLQIYKAEYDKMDAEIQDINDKASLASYYIDKEKDQDILRMHDAYMQDLNALADSFVSGGMTAEKRAAAKRLRQRYGSEISNILVAAQERQKEIEEQRQALLKNPSLLFNRYAQNTPLSEYYMKPNRESYVPLDLDKIKADAAKMAATITASYPKTTTIENAYDENGDVVEGWVTKRTKAGPKDSVEEIFRKMNSGSSEYSGYSSIRDALRNSAQISKFDGDIQDRINAAIDAGIREGIVSGDSSEVAADPTYNKTGSSSKDGGVDLSSLGLPVQRTTSTPVGAITDEKKMQDKKTLEGLNELPVEAQAERGEVLRIAGSNNQSFLNLTTAKLDTIWQQIQNHIANNEKAANEARQADARLNYDPVAKAQQNKSMNTPTWGAGTYGAIGQVANDPIANAHANYQKTYHDYDNKLNELKEAYYKEAEKVIKTLPNQYKTMKDDIVNYIDYETYNNDLKEDAVRTDNAEVFTLDNNVKKQLYPALVAIKSINGNYTTGLYDVDKKKYVGASNVLVNKENEAADGKINFASSANVTAGIEEIDGKYEFVLYGKDGKRYAVRGIPQFDFAHTVGEQIEFLSSKNYNDSSNKQPVKLSSSIDEEEFTRRTKILEQFPGSSLEDVEKFLGVEINDNNVEVLGTAGSKIYYGIKVRSADGNNILNLVFDKNWQLASFPGGAAEIFNPRTQSRTNLLHLGASKYLTDMVGNAWLDYGGTEKTKNPNRPQIINLDR